MEHLVEPLALVALIYVGLDVLLIVLELVLAVAMVVVHLHVQVEQVSLLHHHQVLVMAVLLDAYQLVQVDA